MAVCFITVVVIGFIFTAVNAARGGQPIVPVSYTHLDVYKRQG